MRTFVDLFLNLIYQDHFLAAKPKKTELGSSDHLARLEALRADLNFKRRTTDLGMHRLQVRLVTAQSSRGAHGP